MRITLIGPVSPYRGGIAQYTAQLHAALGNTDDRLTLSYSRQYPAMLYPGGNDKEPQPHRYLPDVEYSIDAANPLSWSIVGRRILDFDPDLIVVQWWHVYWAPFMLWAKRLAKSNGKRLTVICHNVDDHETSKWKVRARNFALDGCEDFLVHSHSHAELIRAAYPESLVRMHPIPAYTSFPEPDTNLKRRAQTELLFFGLIRPYKGLDVLLRALCKQADKDFHLTVAGESWDGVAAYEKIISEGGYAHRVEILSSYVSDQMAANLFARADAIVLPYKSASGSAVAALAFNYHKPVVASRIGGLPDIIAPGTGILVEAGNVDDLAEALSRVMDGNQWYESRSISEVNRRLTWGSLASELKR